MSHAAVRIVADWLEGATNGLNACAAAVPRLGSDEAPPSVTVYDETQDAWVARGLSPDAADATAGITFPMCVVKLLSGSWEGGKGQAYESGRLADGTVQVVCEIVQEVADTIDGVTDGMYLMRGLRGSLALLDNAPQTDRDAANATIVLHPSTRMEQRKMAVERGDKLIADALIVTYPVFESTPATA